MKMLSKVAVLAAVTAAMASSAAFAADKAEMEHCYGVAKAGKNDCKGNGVASCAGSSKKDGEGFLALPKGACEKIVGGSVTDPTAAK